MFFHHIPSLFLFIPATVFFCFLLFSYNRSWHKIVLLFLSLVFYGFDHPWFVLPLLLSASVDYYVSSQLITLPSSSRIRPALLSLSLIVNISLLVVFKYTSFIEQTFSFFLIPEFLNFQLPSFLLPAGISFYTFQTLSFTIDCFRLRCHILPYFPNYLLYVCYFPQLVAGPILRFADFFDSNSSPFFNPDFNLVLRGLHRLICGLFLKLVLADELARLNDVAFSSDYTSLAFLDAWTMTIGFGLQIYFDFSAYSHMAIGISLMLGLKIPENFKFPYLSSSPSSFWRNWHITLSSWIRDYLYSFLVSRLPRACFGFLPLCLTWCLMGLWHGPSWMFIFWGFLNSIFILCYRLIKSIFDGASNLNPFFFLLTGWFFTFIFIMSSWIFFRSNSWEQASYLYLLLFSPITGFTLHLRENYYLLFSCSVSLPSLLG